MGVKPKRESQPLSDQLTLNICLIVRTGQASADGPLACTLYSTQSRILQYKLDVRKDIVFHKVFVSAEQPFRKLEKHYPTVKRTNFLNRPLHRCSSWFPILRARGGLVNKVRTLLQWDPEARVGSL